MDTISSQEKPITDSVYVEALTQIIWDAIKEGYHACDESVPGWSTPRGGCRCWIENAKVVTDWVDG